MFNRSSVGLELILKVSTYLNIISIATTTDIEKKGQQEITYSNATETLFLHLRCNRVSHISCLLFLRRAPISIHRAKFSYKLPLIACSTFTYSLITTAAADAINDFTYSN